LIDEPPVDLPPCELSKLEEIEQIVKCPLSSPMQQESRIQRECLVRAIKEEDYIPKLIELFHMCEDLGNLEGLYHLHNIFRTFFVLNKEALLQIMFQSSLIMDVIGCLEYNPANQNRVYHREYIKSKSSFKEVIPFEDKELVNKIHHLYRVVYIQEVILPTPSLFEENLMSALNHCITYYKLEIITTLQVCGILYNIGMIPGKFSSCTHLEIIKLQHCRLHNLHFNISRST